VDGVLIPIALGRLVEQGRELGKECTVQKLVQGIHRFQADIFRSQRELFAKLANGQSPEALFITCSDSRINPNLITQTDPGELFILRNAGNIIPPYGASNGGEGPTIEFAVAALGVKDIIVCGHSLCGAMKGLLDREALADMPAVHAWLGHAEATRRIMREKYADRSGAALLTATIEENVLVQLENLRTHPAVAVGLSKGTLKLHGWVYKIETGEVFAYDPAHEQFLPLTETLPTPAVPPALVHARSI
jgi:carbonic anhydrase